MKNYNDSVVCITGASSGIGEALAYQFAKEGATLALIARRKEVLEQVQSKCLRYTSRCFIFPFDLSKTEELGGLSKEILNKTEKVDILVNNAGISQRSLAEETPLEIDRKIMEINFFSAVALTKQLLPSMISKKGGHIVVISSVVGKFGFPMRTAYSASKHAVQGYFESLRAELNPYKIKVTIVSPGRIRTEVSRNALTKEGQPHGQMDPGQEKGMDVTVSAKRIVRGIKRNKKDFLVGRQELVMVFLRRFFPSVYHRMVLRVSAT
ncbi:MAG TPA: short chain dehydrogenase [Flavobacteriales bacterium]|mgnify:CR=1 FL=1|nr:short chain dehydrogenase [Flavobacteriales bacterium]